MKQLESTLVFAQEKLSMGHRYSLYESEEEDKRGRKIIGGVYILQAEIVRYPPGHMTLQLDWT